MATTSNCNKNYPNNWYKMSDRNLMFSLWTKAPWMSYFSKISVVNWSSKGLSFPETSGLLTAPHRCGLRENSRFKTWESPGKSGKNWTALVLPLTTIILANSYTLTYMAISMLSIRQYRLYISAIKYVSVNIV